MADQYSGTDFMTNLLEGFNVAPGIKDLFGEYDPTQENYMRQQHTFGQQQQRQGFGQQLMGLGQQQRQQQAGSGFAGGGGGRGFLQARGQLGQQFGQQQQAAQSQLGQGIYGLQQSFEEQQRGTLADLISSGAVTARNPEEERDRVDKAKSDFRGGGKGGTGTGGSEAFGGDAFTNPPPEATQEAFMAWLAQQGIDPSALQGEQGASLWGQFVGSLGTGP